jgi:hypothetical protein
VEFAGRVVAAAGGAPVSGATVSASGLDGASATTGPDGAFRLLAGRPGGWTFLQARATGFADAWAMAVVTADGSEDEEIEIRLEKGGRIRGTVRDTRGNPVAGASVAAAPSPGGGGFRSFDRTPACISGPDGAYSLEGVEAGGFYGVRAGVSPPGSGPAPFTIGGDVLIGRREGGGARSFPVEVYLPEDPPEAVADLVVPILRGSLAVAWRDAGGRSDGIATIALFAATEGGRASGEVFSEREGPSGTVLDLPEGRYRVTAFAEGRGFGEAEALVAGDGRSEVEVVLGAAPSLAGIVVDGDGRPLVGVTVEARGTRPAAVPLHRPPAPIRISGSIGPRAVLMEWAPSLYDGGAYVEYGVSLRARTDADGRFLLDGFREGSAWTLVAWGESIPPVRFGPYAVPSREIRIAAPRPGAVEGRLVLPPGPVPEGRSIHFRSASGSAVEMATLRSVAALGDGRFRIENLPPGPATVWAAAGEHAWGPVEVEVPEGGTADAGEVALESGVTIRGTVVRALGTPPARAVVRAPRGDGFVQATTDRAGSFTLEGIGRGTVRFSVEAAGATTTHAVEVPPPEGAPVVLRIPGRGEVRGTARDAAGIPLAGWRVAVRAGEGAGESWVAVAGVSHRGAFRAPLEAGEQRLALLPPDSTVPAAERAVAIPDGDAIDVEFRVER